LDGCRDVITKHIARIESGGKGGIVTFEEILQQTIEILQHRGRVSYRALKRQFALDDAYLDDLKAELLYAYPHVVDEDGRGLAWPTETAASSTAPAPSSPAASHESVREPRAYTPQHLVEKILTSRTALEGERKQVTGNTAKVTLCL
jgi:hypothetical protein